jgi:GTP-binding protein HflX
LHHDELDQEVDKVLGELGVLERPRLHVFNKVDQLTPQQREEFTAAWRNSSSTGEPPIFVSALTGEGIDELLRRIEKAVPIDPVVRLSLRIPMSEGRTLALIHALGRVVESHVNNSSMELQADVPETIVRRLKLNDFLAQETSRRGSAYKQIRG